MYPCINSFLKLANERDNGAQNMWSSKPRSKRNFLIVSQIYWEAMRNVFFLEIIIITIKDQIFTVLVSLNSCSIRSTLLFGKASKENHDGKDDG